VALREVQQAHQNHKNGALCSCVAHNDGGSIIPLTVYNFDAGALAALSRNMQAYLDAAPLQA
jgi:hypothetical protein